MAALWLLQDLSQPCLPMNPKYPDLRGTDNSASSPASGRLPRQEAPLHGAVCTQRFLPDYPTFEICLDDVESPQHASQLNPTGDLMAIKVRPLMFLQRQEDSVDSGTRIEDQKASRKESTRAS